MRELAGLATCMIEPHEEQAYREANAHGRFVVLPERDRGISYVRNAILRAAREAGHQWFWMVDDDVQRWSIYPGREIVSPLEALAEAQRSISRESMIGVASLEHRQYAWQAMGSHFNKSCDGVVAINVAHTRLLNYREELPLKVDRDFALQVLSSGRRTMRVGHVGFASPTLGSNKGGLHEAYRARESEAVDKMCKIWGPALVTRVVKKGGRVDCKINWRAFRSSDA